VGSPSNKLRHPVVAIGNFDGVHLGHQAILSTAIRQAREAGGSAVAYTFRPHPRAVLNPGANIPLLLTYDEKLEILSGLGLDAVVEEPFSREFSSRTPERFFTESLIQGIGARAVVVGYDFAFGRERGGDLDGLRALCEGHGVKLTVVQPVSAPGGPDSGVVSSSRIRKLLLEGDVASAAKLMGRQFFYRGKVIRGDGRGRKLGFPTANLRIEDKLALPHGVYVTRAGGQPSVTNVGVRPTFGEGLPLLVETHLLDRSADLYGSVLEVRFVSRLRDERKFDGIESLKAQIAADIAAARRYN
jgi:riboflavin kinase/FMN adenylyltransferase